MSGLKRRRLRLGFREKVRGGRSALPQTFEKSSVLVMSCAALSSLHGTLLSVPEAKYLKCGALAQLGERLICIQEVRSSILLGSTNLIH